MESAASGQGGGREAKSWARRLELVGRIADILLAEGRAQIPLRDLAAKLGTSDRMLLYYFDDKADLVRASLMEVSSRLSSLLIAAPSADPLPPDRLFKAVIARFESEAMAPFMTVWADVTARSGRGEAPFRAFAQASVAGWLAWLEQRLDVEDPGRRRDLATAILAVVEGARLLEASAPGSCRRVAEILSRSFDAER